MREPSASTVAGSRGAEFDVVVVGGGPAGSSAARVLAAGGARVCVVDKATFPRDKLCGGLLTLRSQRVFSEIFATDWRPAIEVRSRGVEFHYRRRFLTAVRGYTELFFTCRRRFDAFLLDQARQAGAQLRQGTAVKQVDRGQSLIQLADGSSVRGRFIVGADGVNSVVAKSLFGEPFDKNQIGFALEMEVPRAAAVDAVPDPEIYFGLLPWGYGWVFPKADTLTAGVGGLHRVNPDLRERFEVFLKQRFGVRPSGRIRGHYIPFGSFREDPAAGNILLCGDAAGLVDPITGEGIAFAMQSGAMAGRAICNALRAGQAGSAADLYRRDYARITDGLKRANALRFLLFPRLAQYLLSRALPRSHSLPRKHLDLMADKLSYRDYVRFLLGKAATGMVRTLRPGRAGPGASSRAG